MTSKTELPDLTDGEVVERISKAELKPLYDVNHEHVFARDPDDETDDYYAEICTVRNCNLGRLIAKV